VEIDVAEDEANHVSTFTISIDNEKVYCATGTSRRMFEWIFILRHLKVFFFKGKKKKETIIFKKIN